MIRVVLPAHLRMLAHVDGEVNLNVERPVTRRAQCSMRSNPVIRCCRG
jgi:hypothetical protein